MKSWLGGLLVVTVALLIAEVLAFERTRRETVQTPSFNLVAMTLATNQFQPANPPTVDTQSADNDLPKVGQFFPDLSLFKLEGAIPDLKGRVILLDLWASWCVPCKESFRVMKDLHERFASRGLLIVAVSLDEKKSSMERFLEENPIPFVTLRDPFGRMADAFGIEKLPTSFLIGANGKIVAVHEKFAGESTRQEYFREIQAALKAAGK